MRKVFKLSTSKRKCYPDLISFTKNKNRARFCLDLCLTNQQLALLYSPYVKQSNAARLVCARAPNVDRIMFAHMLSQKSLNGFNVMEDILESF